MMQQEPGDGVDPWWQVWQRKGRAASARLENGAPGGWALPELLAFNGYDSAAATMTTENWLRYTGYLATKLGIEPGSAVCEVGCGAGALLLPLWQRGARAWGVDYSEGLIRVCRDVMPSGCFAVGEAARLPLESGQFDAVFSNGVFIYFPDLAYAEEAFAEKARLLKPGGSMALLDMNDAARREEFVAVKIRTLGKALYESTYRDHHHLFYSRDWVREQAAAHGLDASVEDQVLEGYPNAEFRFNAFLRKPAR